MVGDDEKWSRNTFYRHSTYLLNYLSTFVGVSLISLTAREANVLIRDAMFLDCQRVWSGDRSGCHLRSIIPVWSFGRLDRVMYRRDTTSCYYRCRDGHTCFRGRYGVGECCRFGCHESEDIDHLFFSCPFLDAHRATLHRVCLAKGLVFDLRTLLSDVDLRVPVERFLSFVLDHND